MVIFCWCNYIRDIMYLVCRWRHHNRGDNLAGLSKKNWDQTHNIGHYLVSIFIWVGHYLGHYSDLVEAVTLTLSWSFILFSPLYLFTKPSLCESYLKLSKSVHFPIKSIWHFWPCYWTHLLARDTDWRIQTAFGLTIG